MFDFAVFGAAPAGGNAFGFLVPLVLMFAVFYFLLIRPQQKKAKARNEMLSQVKRGDKIVTIGGIHGTITELTDDIIVLSVNDVTKLTFDRSAINSITKSAASLEEKE